MKSTFIQSIRTEVRTNREKVMGMLQWDDLRYGEYQEQMGYVYLKTEFGQDTLFVDDLRYSQEFWAWWKNHWNKRDSIFLMDAPALDLSERNTLYAQLHNPQYFEFHPHRGVLERSYSNMIDKLIKEAVK